ncbi:response regulator [Cohnella rhizosphaerae]|uniref:Response regulator n=1 Tax=Cohnella rhizosphaerae TaxID=1457232 RepID=A0A9X4KSR4_9BACL|nr:response regulator [Cohnella rhizosphaerae]MDG0808044.1 response regulator [Cohnella rhizosphaerae]
MYRAIIVEDERPVLELMKVLIGRNGNYEIVGAFGSPLQALEKLTELDPDIAFIDVEMPKMSGLELAHRIVERSKRTAIVFSTAYKQYALSAFDVQALDYILKPVTPAAIERVTNRLAALLRPEPASGGDNDGPNIRLLGGFEILSARGELLHFPTRKTEELLAYLLCHPEKDISKWLLTELLWPEKTQERAMASLHTAIYQLKKLLKEQALPIDIQRTREGYFLSLGQMEYDFLLYCSRESEIASGTMTSEQAEALRMLYRGPLLEGRSYIWKIWLEEALKKQYADLVRRLTDENVAERNWQSAERRLHAFLSIYPLDEEMNAGLIELLSLRGQKENMVRHYEQFKRRYGDEFGCEPSEEFMTRVRPCLGG